MTARSHRGEVSPVGSGPSHSGRRLWMVVGGSAGVSLLVLAGVVAGIVHHETSQVGHLAGADTPQQFGAKADGHTDDTRAVQSALDAGAAHHQPVDLEPGTYVISRGLTIPSGTTLEGTGPTPDAATLRFTWTGGAGHDGAGGPYLSDARRGAANIVLSDFAVVGAGNGLPAGPAPAGGLAIGLKFDSVDGLSLQHLDISDTPGDATSYFGVTHLTVRNDTFSHLGRGAVDIHWDNGVRTSDVDVSDDTITDVGDDAVAVNGSDVGTPNTTGQLPDAITIAHNTITGWATAPDDHMQGHGIALLGVTDATVTANTITDVPESAILVRGGALADNVDPRTGSTYVSSDVTITGNTIDGVGEDVGDSAARTHALFADDGIEIDAGAHVDVHDNTVRDVTQQPLAVTTCDACAVTGNGATV